MRKEFLDVVLSKRTMQEVCSHYCKKFVKDVKVEIGKSCLLKEKLNMEDKIKKEMREK